MLKVYARALISWSALAFFLLIAGFAMLADEVSEGATQKLDAAVLAALRVPGSANDPIGPAWFEEAMRDVTALGSFAVLAPLVLLAAAYLALDGKRRTAGFLLVAAISGTILSTAMKMVFDRPRPEFTQAARVFTASFPSGHSLVSAIVYLSLGALLAEQAETAALRRFYFAVAIVATLAIGLSRIYLGVHYPTDVVAGWLLGTSWAICCFWVVRVRRKIREDKGSFL